VTRTESKVSSPARLEDINLVPHLPSLDFMLTAITITKTVIGSAILSIPYVVKEMGYLLTIIIFLVAMTLNQFGTILLLKAKNLSKHSNFATIFYEIWPSRMAKGLGSILIFLNNIGICTKINTKVSHS